MSDWKARALAEGYNPRAAAARRAAAKTAAENAAAEARKPLPAGHPYSDAVLTEQLRRARLADRAAGTIAECETLLAIPFERRADVHDLAMYILHTTPGIIWSEALNRAATATPRVHQNMRDHNRHIAEHETAMRWIDEDGTHFRQQHNDTQYK